MQNEGVWKFEDDGSKTLQGWLSIVFKIFFVIKTT